MFLKASGRYVRLLTRAMAMIFFIGDLSVCDWGRQFLDVDIAPTDFSSMSLQLYGPTFDQGFSFRDGCLSVPEIVQGGLVNYEFVIEDDSNEGAFHGNVK
jgi:hypothetical protein